MNRRTLIIIGVIVLFVFGLVIYIITASQGSLQANTAPVPTHAPLNANAGIKSYVHPTITPNSPSEVAALFYKWYITYKGSPLATGAYLTSPYLTRDYKLSITGLYHEDTSNDPIICAQDRDTNVVVQPATFDVTGHNAQVMISDATTGRYVQRVVLVITDGSWLINDIDCE